MSFTLCRTGLEKSKELPIKRGVILLLTITFITALLTLAAWQYGLVEKSLKRTGSEAFTYQTITVLRDLQQVVLPELFKTVVPPEFKDMDDLNKTRAAKQFFYWFEAGLPIELGEDIGRVIMSMTPAYTKLNVNRLKALNADSNRTFLTRYLEEQGVYDPLLLYQYIDYTLKTLPNYSYEHLEYDDSFVLNRPDFMRGEIIDLAHFNTILDAYATQLDDDKVKALSWEGIVEFESDRANDENQSLNFNFLGSTYCRVLANELVWLQGGLERYCDHLDDNGEYDPNLVFSRNELPQDAESNRTLRIHNIDFRFNPWIKVRLDLLRGDYERTYTFLFNMETGRSTKLKSVN